MQTMTITTAVAVPPINLQARLINDAHRRVKMHARGMLFEAKQAGDALLRVKEMLPHGSFKQWVEDNCECSYEQAMKYMRVSKRSDKLGPQANFEGGINAFLDAHAETRKPSSKAPTFDANDAEHAKKLHALATRGATEGERSAAQRKLDTFSGTFGMTGEEVMEKAEKVSPTKTADDYLEERKLAVLKQRLTTRGTGWLVDALIKCVFKHPDLLKEIY